jgi:putative oxidoreductase
MHKLLYPGHSSKATDFVLLVLRISAGALMLTHGWPKLLKLLAGPPYEFADVMGMGQTLTLILAVFAEFLCSVFLIFGFVTRLAVIPLIITMLIAVFQIHADDPFSKQEKGILFLVIYFALLVLGSGRYSIDKLMSGNKKKRYSRRNFIF